MCTFGVLGLSCEAPEAPKPRVGTGSRTFRLVPRFGPPRDLPWEGGGEGGIGPSQKPRDFFGLAESPNVQAPGLRKNHQNSMRRHPEKEREKEQKWKLEREKCAKFWPHPSGPILRGPTFSRFRPSPFEPLPRSWPHPPGPHHDTHQIQKWIGQNWIDPKLDWPKLAKSGWPNRDWPKSVPSVEVFGCVGVLEFRAHGVLVCLGVFRCV